MKTIKLLILLPILALVSYSYAATITISGKVTDNGVGKSGIQVIWTDSASNFSDTALTNSAGLYSITLNTGNATQGFAYGTITDCKSKTVFNGFFYSPRATSYPNKDFVYCSGSGGGGGGAPFTATISGNFTNLPASGNVVIYADTLGGQFPNWTDTVSKSSTGYRFSFTCYNDPQDVWVYFINCKNDTIMKKIPISSTKPNLTKLDWDYCPTTGGGGRSSIGGFVYTGNMMAMSGIVLLVEKSAGTLTAIDTAIIQRGIYHFAKVDSTKDYLVKAILNKLDSNYKFYLPTYADSALRWNNAKSVKKGSGKRTKDIYMVKGNNTGGPGFIGGKVSRGANKSGAVGDPIEGAQIMLLQAGAPVDYVFSDAKGEFEFNSLAYGTYTVYTEVIGLPTTSYDVTLSAADPKEENVKVSVNNSGVTTWVEATGIASVGFKNELRAYPNPVQNQMTIEFGELLANAQIKLIDITGKVVASQELNNASEVKVSFIELNKGTYFIQVQSGENNSVIRVVKH